MSEEFTVSIAGDTELMAALSAMPEKLRQALSQKVHELTTDLERQIKEVNLEGAVLNHKTGALKRSIFFRVDDTDTGSTGMVWQDNNLVPYGRIHEFGGVTSPHRIEAKEGGALAFSIDGKQFFRKAVNHPGSHMPERSFMRNALDVMRDRIVSGIREVVSEAVQW